MKNIPIETNRERQRELWGHTKQEKDKANKEMLINKSNKGIVESLYTIFACFL